MSKEAEKVLNEAEATVMNEETKQETTAMAPIEEEKPNIFAKAWNGVKKHKGVILGTIGAIGAGIVGFVLGAVSAKSDDDGYYDYGDTDSENATPFYGGSDDETNDFTEEDSNEEIS